MHESSSANSEQYEGFLDDRRSNSKWINEGIHPLGCWHSHDSFTDVSTPEDVWEAFDWLSIGQRWESILGRLRQFSGATRNLKVRLELETQASPIRNSGSLWDKWHVLVLFALYHQLTITSINFTSAVTFVHIDSSSSTQPLDLDILSCSLAQQQGTLTSFDRFGTSLKSTIEESTRCSSLRIVNSSQHSHSSIFIDNKQRARGRWWSRTKDSFPRVLEAWSFRSEPLGYDRLESSKVIIARTQAHLWSFLTTHALSTFFIRDNITICNIFLTFQSLTTGCWTLETHHASDTSLHCDK